MRRSRAPSNWPAARSWAGCTTNMFGFDLRQAPPVKTAIIRGGHVPKHRLFRPISIAAATWPRVADGFDKTAETASHFVGAFSRSPAQPVNMKANNRATILIGAIYANSVSLSGFSQDTRPAVENASRNTWEIPSRISRYRSVPRKGVKNGQKTSVFAIRLLPPEIGRAM